MKTGRKDKTVLPPLLKWAGGKRWLVPTLAQLWQQHEGRRLVEPFCGGLAVALGLQPQSALLNDANPVLINFYRAVQQNNIVFPRLINQEAAYYRNRDYFNSLLKTGLLFDNEIAGLTYYLNRTGFNGLTRFNSDGAFNVPFGKYRTIIYTKDFSAYREVFRRWQFTSADFSELPIEASDFIYADPPYDCEFTQYTAKGFKWEDQIRLVEWLNEQAFKGVPVVASNAATERILELYRSNGFIVQTIKAPRSISANGNRTPALEILTFKNLC